MREKPKLAPATMIHEDGWKVALVLIAACVVVTLALLLASCVVVNVDLTGGDKLEHPTIEQGGDEQPDAGEVL